MLPRPIRVRRARRDDLVPVLEILGAMGAPVPPPDRATLRRFRRLVADLGADLYVATADECVIGLVHMTYARQVATSARARIELLAAQPAAGIVAVSGRLLDWAVARARERGCCELAYEAGLSQPGVVELLSRSGWVRDGTMTRRLL